MLGGGERVIALSCGPDRIRTDDLLTASQTRYQLRHGPERTDSTVGPAPGPILTFIDGYRIVTSMNVDVRPAASLPVVECCTPLRAPGMSDTDAVATASLFKALGDPNRVRIVNLLGNAAGPVCVCDITAAVGLAQPTVSFHLRKLVDAGLLQREQRGTWAYYSIDHSAFQTLRELVSRRRSKR